MAIDELVLLEKIANGDCVAFESFYKLYYPRLYSFFLRMTGQDDGVEELIQDTLLFVWNQPDRFNHTSKVSTWVFGIAYNKSLKALAKSNRYSGAIDIDELSEILVDPTADLAADIENQDWLNRALTTLPPDQRAVIELTFFNGLAYQEIAKILDCPENTVKTRMFHARKKLQAFVDGKEN